MATTDGTVTGTGIIMPIITTGIIIMATIRQTGMAVITIPTGDLLLHAQVQLQLHLLYPGEVLHLSALPYRPEGTEHQDYQTETTTAGSMVQRTPRLREGDKIITVRQVLPAEATLTPTVTITGA